jgi:hypothetical protein
VAKGFTVTTLRFVGGARLFTFVPFCER